MGSVESAFTKKELEDYKELTYFTTKEILHIFRRFKNLAPDVIEQDKMAVLPKDLIYTLPELRFNPFRHRICKVFSSTGNGNMNFEDILDMFSVFSEYAPKSIKVEYAFRIFDFDEDDVIGREDISQILLCLTNNRIKDTEIQQVTDHILAEADLDEDQYIAFAEFEHVLNKAPDFMNAFSMKI